MTTARLHRKRWSCWDDSMLTAQHGHASVQSLANQLGRTPGAVRSRARVRKLSAPSELLFSPEEILSNETLPTRHQAAVEIFMRLAGQETPAVPTVPDEATRQLRARMILEEALETIHALGVTASMYAGGAHYDLAMQGDSDAGYNEHMVFTCSHKPDLVEIADGVADVIVVATGTALACGIRPEPIQQLVDESNLAKFGPGSKRREDGKWLKPPGWEPPKIAEELQRQGWTP
jgi:predicted HAD superfamily Cof-like phosphohydrolase